MHLNAKLHLKPVNPLPRPRPVFQIICNLDILKLILFLNLKG